MKTLATTLLLSLALVGVGAQAAGAEQAKGSAQVATELEQAKISGQYAFGELEYQAAATAPAPASVKTQADVQKELAQAKASGQYTFGELEYPPTTR